mgnify:CR=1 FL=1
MPFSGLGIAQVALNDKVAQCLLRALISTVPLLARNTRKRTSIAPSRYGKSPQASDDMAFADLVRLAGS